MVDNLNLITNLSDYMMMLIKNIFEFLLNVSWGYVLILSIFFVASLITIWFKFFRNVITYDVRRDTQRWRR